MPADDDHDDEEDAGDGDGDKEHNEGRHAGSGSRRTKMTGGTPEVHPDKNLTLLTFDI